MQTTSSYNLDATKLDAAVDIIDREISPLKSIKCAQQKTIFRLTILIRTLGCASVAILMLANHRVISGTTTLVCLGVLGAVFIGFLVVADVGQVQRSFRVRRIQRSLGIEPERMDTFLGGLGLTFSRKMTLRQLPGFVIFSAGIVLSMGVFYVSFYLGYKEGFGRWTLDLGIISFIVLNYFITWKGLKLGLYRYMEPLNQRIEDNERIRMQLITQKKFFTEAGEGEKISIPETDYKRIARIERALVSRDRQQTLKKKSPPLHPIQLSPCALKKRSAMEASALLKVQSQIDQLSTDLQPPGAHKEAQGVWSLPVPESSWEISYSLVGDPQLVRIHDIRERVDSKITQQKRGEKSV